MPKENFEDMDALAEKLGEGRYELPDGSILQVGPPVEEKMNISPETQEKLDKLLAKVDEKIPPVGTVRLKPKRGTTTVFDSKLGGVPYFPKGMEYPTVREGYNEGKPLRLLAQLNLSALPRIEGFPTEGMLQFFVFPDDLYGADFDALCDQNGFRVIWHDTVTTDTASLLSEDEIPKNDDDDNIFPFEGEFLLIAEMSEKMGACQADFRFDKAVAEAYNELFGGDVVGMWDSNGKGIRQVDEPLYDAIFSRGSEKTRMGGFPFFTQEDPRGYKEELSGHTVLLFQSDSENGGEDKNWDDEICWGDMGVANFFITPEALAKRDFSNVIYTWDCG